MLYGRRLRSPIFSSYSLPEKDEGMIEKIDLGAAMGGFAQAGDAGFVYGELANGAQVKIRKEILMDIGGLYSRVIEIRAGEKIDLPYRNGLILAQNASSDHSLSLALLYSNGSGKVIYSGADIVFFSEIDNAICIFNTGTGKNYIVKNNKTTTMTVCITFIKQS